MKRLLFLCFLTVTLAPFGRAIEINEDITAPPDPVPMIQDRDFVNNAVFNVSFLSGDPDDLFETHDTLNYTNNGTIIVSPGFNFAYNPVSDFIPLPGQTPQRMAANFMNEADGPSGGIISAFGTLQVLATNIANSGGINVGAFGLARFQGQHVDLSDGSIIMSNNISFNGGLHDGYWGVGDNVMNPDLQF